MLSNKEDPSRNIIAKLGLYQPYPVDIDTWCRQQEQLKVASFLAGLDPAYASSKNQFLATAELPSLSVTFSRLSRIQVETDSNGEADNIALTTSIHSPSNSA